MSKFLGPIHLWMDQKIGRQEELTRDLAAKAKELGWTEMTEDLFAACVRQEETSPLEERIDLQNIHGWLQGSIHDAEARYAKLVTTLMAVDPARIEVMKNVAYAFGARHASGGSATAFDVYHDLDGTFLSGMPCDHVNTVTIQEEDHFAWDEEEDLHSAYWQQTGGDPANYFLLRSAAMQGLVERAGFALTVGDHHYEISRLRAR